MTHGSLFSGIGGFDLAAQWAGWTNVFNCEIDPFCQKVLKHHFPNSNQYGDIKQTNFSRYKGAVNVISGGFPCQPFSIAGKRRGTDDDRHLWDQMLRAISDVSPSWVVGENVLGIVNWSKGLVFEQVCLDLETEGYEIQPFVLPAASVGAPHQRYRVWFVAAKNTNTNGRHNINREEESDIWKFRNISTGNSERIRSNNAKTWTTANSGLLGQTERQEQAVGIDELCNERIIADTNGERGKGGSNDGLREKKIRKSGQVFSANLRDLAISGLLPTPTATSDAKGGCTRPNPKYQNATLAHSMHGAFGERGRSSQLNPLFVEEMMGFPENWTLLPFQSGETKQSKRMVMPLFRKLRIKFSKQ